MRSITELNAISKKCRKNLKTGEEVPEYHKCMHKISNMLYRWLDDVSECGFKVIVTPYSAECVDLCIQYENKAVLSLCVQNTCDSLYFEVEKEVDFESAFFDNTDNDDDDYFEFDNNNNNPDWDNIIIEVTNGAAIMLMDFLRSKSYDDEELASVEDLFLRLYDGTYDEHIDRLERQSEYNSLMGELEGMLHDPEAYIELDNKYSEFE